jgi:hypothetical protein
MQLKASPVDLPAFLTDEKLDETEEVSRRKIHWFDGLDVALGRRSPKILMGIEMHVYQSDNTEDNPHFAVQSIPLSKRFIHEVTA